MENSDEAYSEKTKLNEENFLENLKKGKNPANVEEKYQKNAKKIRSEYKKELTKELERLKNQKPKKSKKKKEEQKVLTVEKINLETTWKDTLKFRYQTKKFRVSRKIGQFFRKKPFDTFRYLSYRLKFLLKDLSINLKILKTKIKNNLLKIWKFLKETFNKIISIVTNVITKLNFWKKKKENGKKDKKDKKDKKETNKKNSSNKTTSQGSHEETHTKETNNTSNQETTTPKE